MIQYPVARDQEGGAVPIEKWQRGQSVTCFGCDQELIGRLPHDGIKPTAHFAHKADAACVGETALHKAAKVAIVRARSHGALRSLVWECPRCGRYRHRTDLDLLELREEDRPCDGVVSDVLGRDAVGEPHVAIEVIVTHDVEDQTLERYRERGLQVFTLRPSWKIVADLVRGDEELMVEYRLGEVETATCVGCQQLLREKLEWQDREQRRRAAAWWHAWIAMWHRIGEEVSYSIRLSRAVVLREVKERVSWWDGWQRLWPRIGECRALEWWSAWCLTWRRIGVEYGRPYVWWKSWLRMWDDLGRHYEAREAEDQRRRTEARISENIRRQTWWPTWIRMWADVAQHASGLVAFLRPICSHCRQHLTPAHRCSAR